MAGYKAHIAFGGITALSLSVVVVMLSLVSVTVVPLIFMLTLVGSMLPDVDSDTGVPVRLLFLALSIFTALYTFIYQISDTAFQMNSLLWSIGSAFLVYFVVGAIFKKFTIHRGIFHSIPAALVMGLLSIQIFVPFGWERSELHVIGASVAIGYLCHLLLDELNSAVNLSGVPFIPKRSLGSALKLFSASRRVNLFLYAVLVGLFVSSAEHLL
ncbi:MAG: metal-dependent hydrolase [Candidatus Brocadiales bacterium]|nr:metal-dependent hydrolase [Candidatus Brocadiales bacterium]